MDVAGEVTSFLVVVFITLLLWLLQIGISRMSFFEGHTFTISCLPSLILLPLFTHLVPDINWKFIFLTVLMLVIWYSYLVVSKIKQPLNLCGNLFVLLLGLIYVAVAANANDVKLYQFRMYRYLSEGRIGDALMVGKKSLATDGNLTNIRAYALNRNHELGECLFEYALPEGQIYLNPDYTLSEKMVLKNDTLPKSDYVLCELLLQKKLDEFAAQAKLAVDNGTLNLQMMPKHYREALILYNHLRMNPEWVFSDVQTEQNYRDYMEAYHRETKYEIRSNILRRLYGDTYWWYFHFHK